MPSLKDKSVLVTGGAGFIGSHLIDAMISEKPERIVAVDNFFLGEKENLSDAASRFGIVVENCDAADYNKMKEIVKRNRTDVIFNLAMVPLPTSLEKPSWAFDINVDITRVVCELGREGHYGTLVQFSSSEVYGTGLHNKMTETHPLLPCTPYAASKAACDHLVHSYHKTFGLDMLIIRPFNNYGPRQNDKSYAGIIPITIKRIMNGQTPIIFGTGKQTRDFLYVEDTVRATADAFKSASTRGKIFNVASGRETSINDIVAAICKEMDWTKQPKFEKRRPGDVDRHLGDIELAKKLIGFRPTVRLEDGIKRTVQWYKEKYAKPK
ncbi:MAG: GDP-mannose 4,6-dehydratase [Candidatus Aenigmarchaeota archaeon]|nr:GDP-mannose 4,6-dehydratase [Candidatus Aenigmarchaeota archaeon]